MKMNKLPVRISKRGNSYVLRRHMNGRRFHYYSCDLDTLIDYDRMMDKGIIPKTENKIKENYTENELNKMLDSEKENWKWIKGYEGLYSISDIGSVVSFWKSKRGRRLSISNKNGWYLSFRACNSKREFNTIRIHVAVAEAFIGDIPSGYHVHHKDGNKQNNRADNLEIISPKEHHAETIRQNPHILDGMISYNKGRFTGKYKRYEKNKKSKSRFPKGKILQYTLDGKLVGKYCNSMDAHKETGVCQRNILQVANREPYNEKGNIRKQAGGYIWRFEKEVEK